LKGLLKVIIAFGFTFADRFRAYPRCGEYLFEWSTADLFLQLSVAIRNRIIFFIPS